MGEIFAAPVRKVVCLHRRNAWPTALQMVVQNLQVPMSDMNMEITAGKPANIRERCANLRQIDRAGKALVINLPAKMR